MPSDVILNTVTWLSLRHIDWNVKGC